MKTPTPAGLTSTGQFCVPAGMEGRIDEIISHYPQKRSAALMILHVLQEHLRCLPKEAIEWTADKLGLQPIHILELATFYPMFRPTPIGRHHFKICRTLSCALGGSHELLEYLCEKLDLDPTGHEPQTTADGQFTVEFVECLASCHTAPVIMVNDDFFEGVTKEKLEEIFRHCQNETKKQLNAMGSTQ